MAAISQKRVFLWHTPRSCSSAFMRAMMNRKSCKVFMEPFTVSYFIGIDRQTKRVLNEPTDDELSYQKATQTLQEPYSDYKEIFVKNCAYAMTNHVNAHDLPDGYQHTFLIRQPEKCVQSLYHCARDRNCFGPNQEFEPGEAGFKEVWEMHEFVTTVLGQPSIVIHADDLCSNPEGTLREYCKRVDIPFEEGMLNWKEEDKDRPELTGIFNSFFDELIRSTSFRQEPSENRAAFPDINTLPAIVHKTIQDCLPYYEKMYKLKIQI